MRFFAACLLSVAALPSHAAETITYTYDAKGRILQAVHSGTVNNGVQSDYTFDKADNRTRKKTGLPSAAPSFAIAAGSAVTEGAPLAFTVTKIGSASTSYSVNYATSGGSATPGSDYTASSGTLTFGPSDVSLTVSVVTIDDAVVEAPETVQMTLSGATGGATISTAAASGTINDNDMANHAPVANADSFSIAHCGYAASKNLTANDTDADGDALNLTSLSGTGAAYATIVSSSSIDFSAPGASGSYPITYTISDGHGGTASGSVSVTVTGNGACQ